MPKLKAVLESLDGVDESLRGLYVEREDGKFQLDADGVEDVSGLKSALERVKRDLREAKGKVPADFDPEKYEELLALQEEFSKGKLTEKQREEFENLKGQLKTQHAKELEKVQGQLAQLQEALQHELVTSRATQAIAAKRGSVKLLLPHLKQRSDVQALDGRYTPVILDDDGKVRYGKGDAPMTYDELLDEMIEDEAFRGAFDGTGSSGGGATRSPAGGGSKRVVAADDNSAFIAQLEDIAAGKVQVR
jgi:hypothetical protein